MDKYEQYEYICPSCGQEHLIDKPLEQSEGDFIICSCDEEINLDDVKDEIYSIKD